MLSVSFHSAHVSWLSCPSGGASPPGFLVENVLHGLVTVLDGQSPKAGHSCVHGGKGAFSEAGGEQCPVRVSWQARGG